MLNASGEPISTGKNSALLVKAREFVKRYNECAQVYAAMKKGLLALRTDMNDDVAMGTVMISGAGWDHSGSALDREVPIPMVRMYDEEFPVSDDFTRKIFNESPGTRRASFSFSFCENDVDPNELAARGIKFQEEEAKKGNMISISAAVTAVYKQSKK